MAEQRVFPRIKYAKSIELSVEGDKYAGDIYDISQGGLSFMASQALPVGLANVAITNSIFVFSGRILASQNAGSPNLSRFHFEFSRPLDLVTLAGVIGQ